MLHYLLKSSVAFSLVSTLALGCTRSQNSNTQDSPKPNPILQIEEGGVDGGGGGTLPANPIKVYRAVEIIKNAKKDLWAVFNIQTFFDRKTPSILNSKLFMQPVTLWDIFYSTNLEILEDRACKDSVGRDVDGSIHASRPNTICISAYRIAPKLIEERARTEILALIAHELSHLVGANEIEARQFQAEIADDLSDLVTKSWTENYTKVLATDSQQLFSNIARLEVNVPKMKLSKLADDIDRVVNGFLSFGTTDNFFAQRAFTMDEQAAFELQFSRLALASLWIHSQTGTPESYYTELLDQAFQGADEIPNRQFDNPYSFGPSTDDIYGDVILRRIHDRTELQAEISSISKYIESLATAMGQLSLNIRPNPLPVPNPGTTPWAALVGTYDVVAVTCTPGASLSIVVGFSIAPPSATNPSYRLIQLTSYGYSDIGGLENGADGPLGGGYTSVTGGLDSTGAPWAERQNELGDRWGGEGFNFKQNRIQLRKTPAGLSMVTESYSLDWTGTQNTESKVGCEFVLNKR